MAFIAPSPSAGRTNTGPVPRGEPAGPPLPPGVTRRSSTTIDREGLIRGHEVEPLEPGRVVEPIGLGEREGRPCLQRRGESARGRKVARDRAAPVDRDDRSEMAARGLIGDLYDVVLAGRGPGGQLLRPRRRFPIDEESRRKTLDARRVLVRVGNATGNEQDTGGRQDQTTGEGESEGARRARLARPSGLAGRGPRPDGRRDHGWRMLREDLARRNVRGGPAAPRDLRRWRARSGWCPARPPAARAADSAPAANRRSPRGACS